ADVVLLAERLTRLERTADIGSSVGAPGISAQGRSASMRVEIVTQNLHVGDPTEVVRHVTIRSDGYAEVTWREHPLARRDGSVLLHRAVLFDKLGVGLDSSVACRWCGRQLSWRDGSLIVDHLDGGRLLNASWNVTPSCRAC